MIPIPPTLILNHYCGLIGWFLCTYEEQDIKSFHVSDSTKIKLKAWMNSNFLMRIKGFFTLLNFKYYNKISSSIHMRNTTVIKFYWFNLFFLRWMTLMIQNLKRWTLKQNDAQMDDVSITYFKQYIEHFKNV